MAGWKYDENEKLLKNALFEHVKGGLKRHLPAG